MKVRFVRLIFGAVLLAFSAVGFAQNAQQAGPAGAKAIPRTPDGKPDISGSWGSPGGAQRQRMELTLTPWGNDKYIWNAEPILNSSFNCPLGLKNCGDRGGPRVNEDPAYHCYPPGLVRLGPPSDTVNDNDKFNAFEISQVPGKVILVYEHRNSVRYIYTDEREHPKNLEETWTGHSIGKWDGDTFVVDTIGLRDESWLDSAGHEHSTQLHVVERFRRVDTDTLEIERTLADPIALAKPYTSRIVVTRNPTYDLNENMDDDDCTQYMVRKPAFGEGTNGLLGISDHP